MCFFFSIFEWPLKTGFIVWHNVGFVMHWLNIFLSFVGALSYSELGTLIPKSGGEYAYFTEATIPIIAYLFAWTRTLVLQPSAVAIICMTFASYVVSFFEHCGSPQLPEKLIAVIAIREYLSSFFLFDSLRPINNLSVKQGRVFLGCTSTKVG